MYRGLTRVTKERWERGPNDVLRKDKTTGSIVGSCTVVSRKEILCLDEYNEVTISGKVFPTERVLIQVRDLGPRTH